MQYKLLEKYLAHKAEVRLTFLEIENILGFKLPASAYKHRSWWGNHESSTQALAWLNAGWEVAKVELGKSVTFVRSGE
ncbi:DUF7662 domain-containing protein [Paenibacillus flagellatus]|uniref:DUF7662 domain-containing protein n=1 Tax=Paenibacillus flagellatus TaxID=2211139 RepID=A0A2V5K5K5_9BACL|nr:hypothetical protein [Paenibacillus flagellatus]PYI54042.1 hypothetical protein DLM86_15985 [Paenibacillus flagellatus]